MGNWYNSTPCQYSDWLEMGEYVYESSIIHQTVQRTASWSQHTTITRDLQASKI
jgi:malonyl CoA-acyl carrier protein transacylase